MVIFLEFTFVLVFSCSYLRSIISHQNSSHTVSELIGLLDAIDLLVMISHSSFCHDIEWRMQLHFEISYWLDMLLSITCCIEEVMLNVFAGKEIQISFREGIEAYQPEIEILLGSQLE